MATPGRDDDTGRADIASATRRAVTAAATLARAALRPERPDRLPRAMLALAWSGPTMAGAVAAATARYPRAPAVVDTEGTLTYGQLWRGTDPVARSLRDRGIGPGRTVGILARNHRSFVQALVAAAKVGADIVYLNTGFAGPQLADVVADEQIDLVVHDDEFAPIVAGSGVAQAVSGAELASLAARRDGRPVLPARHQGRTVILTSGTTGRPKGAVRGGASAGVDALTPLLSTVPVRARDTVVIAAPLFHAWGLAHLGISLGMSSTVVLAPHFDPEATLALIDRHRPGGLVVVPVMLQRILALGDDVIAGYDTSSLRYIASSGSALGAPLATAVLDRFGPILYNIYGSTEVSLASIARPADLLDAPSTAGRVAPGSTVRILDDDGGEAPPGEVGRVFVGAANRFDGYTGGGGKESVGGLLATGDLGHFDRDGRLFIAGRDDDMIVSGGENVYPAEVEDVIAGHPAVVEVAVVGIPDEQFGQRLKAFVVRRPGAKLTAADVKGRVRAQLARYKVPAQVEFVDALPRNVAGKVQRRHLS